MNDWYLIFVKIILTALSPCLTLVHLVFLLLGLLVSHRTGHYILSTLFLIIFFTQALPTIMLASGSKKKAVPPTAAPSKLRTPLTAGTLPPLLPTPQSKEVWMDNARGNNLGNNNIAVTTTLIQMIKILKIYEFDFYYGDQNKLKKCLYQIQINIWF